MRSMTCAKLQNAWVIHLLEAQEGQAMRREDSLVQLPSEIIHISLQQPSPPVPAALSGTSIKAKVLNALATY